MRNLKKKIATILVTSLVLGNTAFSAYANEISERHSVGTYNLNVGRSFVGKTGPVNKSVANEGSGTMNSQGIQKTSGSQIEKPQINFKMVNSDNADRSKTEYVGKYQKLTFSNTGSKGYNYYLKIWSKTYISKNERLNVKGSWSPDIGDPH